MRFQYTIKKDKPEELRLSEDSPLIENTIKGIYTSEDVIVIGYENGLVQIDTKSEINELLDVRKELHSQIEEGEKRVLILNYCLDRFDSDESFSRLAGHLVNLGADPNVVGRYMKLMEKHISDERSKKDDLINLLGYQTLPDFDYHQNIRYVIDENQVTKMVNNKITNIFTEENIPDPILAEILEQLDTYKQDLTIGDFIKKDEEHLEFA